MAVSWCGAANRRLALAQENSRVTPQPGLCRTAVLTNRRYRHHHHQHLIHPQLFLAWLRGTQSMEAKRVEVADAEKQTNGRWDIREDVQVFTRAPKIKGQKLLVWEPWAPVLTYKRRICFLEEHLILRRFTLKVRFDLRRSCAPAALGVAGGRATQRSAPPPTGPVTPRRVPMDARLW
ncbi:unnamed protein product [Mesocestoides corti]|uniref:Uncharacterized protein n=1 Tax=Mesocestoides corti TaxID=53468 RepID=A0A0R3U5K8_MESCO|nr:unnamed protein product [Mesocestoides corti]